MVYWVGKKEFQAIFIKSHIHEDIVYKTFSCQEHDEQRDYISLSLIIILMVLLLKDQSPNFDIIDNQNLNTITSIYKIF